MTALLALDNLHVAFGGKEAVRGVSFALAPGERLGLVGESGSGKTLSARALLGLLPRGARVRAARYAFDGKTFDIADSSALAALRGRGIAMVLQDPKYALNPTMTAGAQIAEVCGRVRALDLLARVGLRDPETVFEKYPHMLSGGMGQRVMIAMMLAAEPKVLIADEPTSALDATVAGGILRLLDEIVAERRMTLLFISHDLDLVGGFCDRVAVMYAGRIVERLDASALGAAAHPYTKGLLACRPRLEAPVRPLPVLARDPAWAAP